eukprot:scaffold14369_cov184-Ochromonas_danica.AAC.1
MTATSSTVRRGVATPPLFPNKLAGFREPCQKPWIRKRARIDGGGLEQVWLLCAVVTNSVLCDGIVIFTSYFYH